MDIKPDYQDFLNQLPGGISPEGNVFGGKYTAVYTQFISDMETPITLYRKLSERGKSFLLESGEGKGKNARFSFLGCNPFLTIKAQKESVLLETDTGETTTREGPPLQVLQEVMDSFNWVEPAALPFSGGAVGYFGYDLAGWQEPLGEPLPEDREMPDMVLIFPRELLAFDHQNHLLTVMVIFQVGEDPAASYEEARNQLSGLVSTLEEEAPENQKDGAKYLETAKENLLDCHFSSNLTQEQFKEKVKWAKHYIQEGEILQLVLSQRLELARKVDPFLAYRTLRSVNPSPYQFFLELGDVALCGSSPEMLVRVERGEVWTRPIAGTRPRGNSPEEDEQLAKELLADKKEQAEHTMLVDLGKEDLGKVCLNDTIRVENQMQIEKFSHVVHLTSDVKGTLEPSRSPLEALQACFPAGTVTGAPKVRAMQLINQLETINRGPYSGAVGYLGFNGNLDTCITIRTIVSHEDRMFIQAGAGVVADSIPHREYHETLQKAQALLKTLSTAEEAIK